MEAVGLLATNRHQRLAKSASVVHEEFMSSKSGSLFSQKIFRQDSMATPTTGSFKLGSKS